MTFAVVSFLAVVVGVVLLFLLWRTLKMFLRLALIGLVVLAVLAGLFAWGWLGSGDGDGRPARPAARNANARRP